MRTPVSIQAQVVNPDGSPSVGTVCVVATEGEFDAEVYPASPACGTISPAGLLTAQSAEALAVWASDDEGYDTTYSITCDFAGQDVVQFRAQVPAASTATDADVQTTEGTPVVTLTGLVACAAMVGTSITGDNWPSGTTVVAFDAFANTLTLSQDATVTGSCSGTVGGAVSLSTLKANAL